MRVVRAALSFEVALCSAPRALSRVSWLRASLGSLYGVLRRCGALVARGRARGAKACERRVWAPYRGRCGLGGARGLGSRSKAFASGAVTCGAREVLTVCSRACIVECDCKCSVRVGCAGLEFVCRSQRFVRSVVRR